MKQIEERLASKIEDWVLVATSCVEAGVDFSFSTGFRESCSVASLVQVAGRINRHSEAEEAEVWDFRLHKSGWINAHPAFEGSREILRDLFEGLNREESAQVVTKAMRQEAKMKIHDQSKELCKAEAGFDFPRVHELYRVIDADTRIVVVDPEIIKALERGKNVETSDLLRGSVQLWAKKIDKIGLRPLFDRGGSSTLYRWDKA